MDNRANSRTFLGNQPKRKMNNTRSQFLKQLKLHKNRSFYWGTDQIEFKLGREIRTNKLSNPMNSFNDRVIKIINDRNLKTLIQKLNNSVCPNETSTTSDQNVLLHRRTHFSNEISQRTHFPKSKLFFTI